MRDEDQQQLDRVLTLVRDVLGPEAVGAYLFGSAVLGGLKPQSDLDVLVVARRQTKRVEKQRLDDRLLAISGRRTPRGRWRRIELTIAVESEIRPWRYPPSLDFLYGDWLRSEFESGNVEPSPTRTKPDLASLITMVLLGNTPLLGPPPAEVFDPVPRGRPRPCNRRRHRLAAGQPRLGYRQRDPDARQDLEHARHRRHPIEGGRRRLGAPSAP